MEILTLSFKLFPNNIKPKLYTLNVKLDGIFPQKVTDSNSYKY